MTDGARTASHPFLRRPPHFIAHRGGSGLAPENTLVAFRGAIADWRADMIELDVRTTADGHCVVIHDPTVDRTTDGTGDVADFTLDELRRLDAGYRFTPDGGATHPFRGRGVRVPTIEEVLDATVGTRLIVEVKTGTAQTPLFRAVERAQAVDRVLAAGGSDRDRDLFAAYPGCISSSGDAMKRMYLLHRLHLIRFWNPGDSVAVQMPLEHDGRRIPSERLVRELHGKGLAVHVWTVNEPEDMRWLFDIGVDGVLSDRPDRLARVMGERFDRPAPPGLA